MFRVLTESGRPTRRSRPACSGRAINCKKMEKLVKSIWFRITCVTAMSVSYGVLMAVMLGHRDKRIAQEVCPQLQVAR